MRYKLLNTYISNNMESIIRFGVTLIVGFILIKAITKILQKSSINSKVDKTVYGFLLGLIKFMLYTAYVIILFGILGVPVTSFIAMFSAIGLAIALALQGNLANFAGALVILFFKPFRIGDFIETGNEIGTVQEIQLLFTYISTPDNRRIIVPNSDLVNNRVINYTAEKNRRIDLVYSAGYQDDVDQVIKVLTDVVEKNDLILLEPVPVIRLVNHGSSALEYDVKVWAPKEEFWNVKYQMNEDVRKAFIENDISIPYPQREVWVNNVKS